MELVEYNELDFKKIFGLKLFRESVEKIKKKMNAKKT